MATFWMTAVPEPTNLVSRYFARKRGCRNRSRHSGRGSCRRDTRIPLGTTAPHASTLGKTTARCGPRVIEALNRALLVKAAGANVMKLDKVCADTTVLEANGVYPTDSGCWCARSR